MSELDPIVLPTDEYVPTDTVFYSDLKKMALSPMHYQHGQLQEFEASRAMKVGTIVHHIVLGPSNVRPLIRYQDGNGSRQGNAWKDFARRHERCEIVTDTEWNDAEPIAKALQADRVAMRLLEGCRFEVPLQWESGGLKCATRGIDVIGRSHVADLKITATSEPVAWKRHAMRMLYPQQMAFYEDGCEANGIDMSEGMFLIGIEASAPHPVTVLRMTEPVLQHGHKSVSLWQSRLVTCRENNHWPPYSQTIVDFELPHWMSNDDE